jgi:hypothetical protein
MPTKQTQTVKRQGPSRRGDPGQSKHLVNAAREAGASEDEAEFNKNLRRLIKAPVVDQHEEVVQTYVSPDGKLRFQIVRDSNGDTRLGFEGFPWHTHADLLVGHYGPTQELAMERFVGDLLDSRSIIALFAAPAHYAT